MCKQLTHLVFVDNIVINANDFKYCFCQIKQCPNIICAFFYILAKYLFLQVGQAFGANSSPSNWEAIATSKQPWQSTYLMTPSSLGSTRTSQQNIAGKLAGDPLNVRTHIRRSNEFNPGSLAQPAPLT